MYKHIVSKFLLFTLALLPLSLRAQQQDIAAPRIDSVALYVMEKVNATFQSLKSCNFTTTTYYDVWVDGLGYIKHSNVSHSSMQFPDKMKVQLTGDKGNHSVWYDGKVFTYYTFQGNQYSQFNFKGSLVQTMDTINNAYGVEFPAADFFYPGFVDDLLNTGGSLIYLGVTSIDGQVCFHIAGNDTNGTVFQFWIREDGTWLPKKMIITYKDESGNSEYEAIYSDWVLNPEIPSAMFDFTAPPAASKVKLVKTLSDENQ